MTQTVANTPNQQTRNEVWNKYFGAEYAFRYYQNLGASFLRKHNRLRGLTVILGGGAVIPALVQAYAATSANVDEWTTGLFAIIGLLLAGVSGANVIGDYAKKAATAAGISKSCGMLTKDFADLLYDIDQGTADDRLARERLSRLGDLVAEVTNASEAAGIIVSNKDKISEEAADSAYHHMERLYAVGRS